jgi:hypothetical protein
LERLDHSKELQTALKREFSFVSRPSDIPEVAGDIDDRRQLLSYLNDKNWDDLAPESLHSIWMFLIWITKRELTYYLPALLNAALCRDAPTDLFEVLVNKIAPPWKKNAPPRLGVELGSFSCSQRQCISDCLLHLKHAAASARMERRVERIAKFIQSEQ